MRMEVFQLLYNSQFPVLGPTQSCVFSCARCDTRVNAFFSMYCFTHSRHPSLEADGRPKVAELLFNFTIVETVWELVKSSSRKLLEGRFTDKHRQHFIK